MNHGTHHRKPEGLPRSKARIIDSRSFGRNSGLVS